MSMKGTFSHGHVSVCTVSAAKTMTDNKAAVSSKYVPSAACALTFLALHDRKSGPLVAVRIFTVPKDKLEDFTKCYKDSAFHFLVSTKAKGLIGYMVGVDEAKGELTAINRELCPTRACDHAAFAARLQTGSRKKHSMLWLTRQN